jgi:nucleoside-triphosphatase THEP1
MGVTLLVSPAALKALVSGYPGAVPDAGKEPSVKAVLVTGTIGSGKSALAEELSLILHERGDQHALIDLDGLGQCYPGLPDDPYNTRLTFANLALVWPNFRARHIRYAVLAHLVERAAELAEVTAALENAELIVVRVIAPPELCAERLRAREISGDLLERHLRRSPVLAKALDELAIEDFTVSNDRRPIREVGLDVIERLGWSAPLS